MCHPTAGSCEGHEENTVTEKVKTACQDSQYCNIMVCRASLGLPKEQCDGNAGLYLQVEFKCVHNPTPVVAEATSTTVEYKPTLLIDVNTEKPGPYLQQWKAVGWTGVYPTTTLSIHNLACPAGFACNRDPNKPGTCEAADHRAESIFCVPKNRTCISFGMASGGSMVLTLTLSRRHANPLTLDPKPKLDYRWILVILPLP